MDSLLRACTTVDPANTGSLRGFGRIAICSHVPVGRKKEEPSIHVRCVHACTLGHTSGGVAMDVVAKVG